MWTLESSVFPYVFMKSVSAILVANMINANREFKTSAVLGFLCITFFFACSLTNGVLRTEWP